MAPIIYNLDVTPTARATFMTVEALGIAVEYREVNLIEGDHLKPEYLKINPLHSVPTLQDGDFAICDSHVINAYLVGKYGKGDSLYPKDLQKRAVVDQRLYFDAGILYNKMRNISFPLVMLNSGVIKEEAAAELLEAYNSLETLLERTTYVAADHVTIADFSIVTTLTSANVLVPVVPDKYPKITAWLAKMQALPYYSANQVGLDKFTALIKSKLA